MNRIDRYLLRELWLNFAATLAVLLMISLSGLLADLLSRIARGKVPASLLLSQLGLRLVDILPLMLPSLTGERRLVLWRDRVDALRQAAAFESTQRLLAARGEQYDAMLVSIE